MATTRRAKTKARGRGRPSLFEAQGQTVRPSWTIPASTVAKAKRDGARIGCSVSNAVTAAIDSFDSDSFAWRRAAKQARKSGGLIDR